MELSQSDYWKEQKNAGIECVVGHRVAKLSNSDGMTLKTFADLGVS
jgi:hypothetical protein